MRDVEASSSSHAQLPPAAASRPSSKPPFRGDSGVHPTIAQVTRMQADVWAKQLLLDPPYDPALSAQILHGITHGVSIGFEGDRERNRTAHNLSTATVSQRISDLVSAVIAKDVAEGKKSGPWDAQPFDFFTVSPIGAVPKGAGIRVIHHLSFPHGVDSDSINAGIGHEDLKLGSFDQACDAIVLAGIGCWLIKLDVDAAYKQVAVRVEDRPLLGFKWNGKFYFELVLPFGLRSSGVRWELYAAALHHFFVHHLGIELVIHYVDDYLFVVPGLLPLAQRAMDGAVDLCDHLEIPLSLKKREGPTTCLIFLGIELDTIAMEARLGPERLADMKQLLFLWSQDRKDCTLQELQSLTGKLQFAAKVVRRGRAYLRRLIDMQREFDRVAKQAPRRRDAPIERHVLSADALADVRWWRDFIGEWNGRALLYDVDWTSASKLELHTDACKVGYGAAFGNRWLRGVWSDEIRNKAKRAKIMSIPFLELLSLVHASRTWGARWSGKRIIFRCDSSTAVGAIRKMTSTDSDMMSLLRLLDMTAALHGFDYQAVHIPGVKNTVADLLSRPALFSFPKLRALLPGALAQPD